MVHSATHSTFPDVTGPFRAVVSGIGWFFTALAEAQDRSERMRVFQTMSDSQLAELGLTREDIVRHVFLGNETDR